MEKNTPILPPFPSSFLFLVLCTFFLYEPIFLSLKGVKHLFLLETSVSSAPDLEFEGVCEVFAPKLAFHPFHPFLSLYPAPFHTTDGIYIGST